MSIEYVPVAEDENEDPIEVPTEPDGTLLLTNLAAQFPGASGLRYRSPETSAMRAVKLVDGVLYQPSELESWCRYSGSPVSYLCTYAKDSLAGRRRGGGDRRDAVKRCTDLIVLGLPYKADEDQLREYFGQFGQVVMTQVKRDHDGNSKGYGFIRFHDYDSQLTCLSARHQMDGRRCEVKIPNSQADGGHAAAGLCKKVFVGRITEDLTETVLREYFGQHGQVEEIYVPKPFRSFAFVTFSDPDTAAGLIGQECVISGVSVHVGPANPKQQTRGGRLQAGGSSLPPVDYGAPPPGMGAWGPPGPYGGAQPGGSASAPYQDVVNSLASNPQLLAAALQQAYHQGPIDPQQQGPASPHYSGYSPYPVESNGQYHQQQHSGPYGYQQQQQHEQQPQPQQPQQQWQ